MKTRFPLFRKKSKKEIAAEEAEDQRALEAEDLLESGKRISAKRMTLLLETMIDLMNNPWRMCWRNFWAGVFRGIGLTIGATIVIALLVKLLSAIISLQIPYLTEWLTEFLTHISLNVKGIAADIQPPPDFPPPPVQ